MAIACLFCVLCVRCACLRRVHGGQGGEASARGSSWWKYTMSRELRERVQQWMPPWPECVERVGGCWGGGLEGGGQRSITNRIHLSAWLIFPIKTAQQEPQQHTSWNRGYFSACLSAGCVRVCVCVCHLRLFWCVRFGEA